MLTLQDDAKTNMFAMCNLKHVRWKSFQEKDLGGPRTASNQSDVCADAVLEAHVAALDAGMPSVWNFLPPQTYQATGREGGKGGKGRGGTRRGVHRPKDVWLFSLDGEDPCLPEHVAAKGLLEEAGRGVYKGDEGTGPLELLFRALHNLIERGMLQTEHVRLGKWFLKPGRRALWPEDSMACTSMHFGLYGTHVVCTEKAERQRLRPLCRQDLDKAAYAEQSAQPHLRPHVYIGPYGLPARLACPRHTQQSPSDAELAAAWRVFYPMATLEKSRPGGAGDQDEGTWQADGVGEWVHVVLEDSHVRMRYPAHYVFAVNYVPAAPGEFTSLADALVTQVWKESMQDLLRCTADIPNSGPSEGDDTQGGLWDLRRDPGLCMKERLDPQTQRVPLRQTKDSATGSGPGRPNSPCAANTPADNLGTPYAMGTPGPAMTSPSNFSAPTPGLTPGPQGGGQGEFDQSRRRIWGKGLWGVGGRRGRVQRGRYDGTDGPGEETVLPAAKKAKVAGDTSRIGTPTMTRPGTPAQQPQPRPPSRPTQPSTPQQRRHDLADWKNTKITDDDFDFFDKDDEQSDKRVSVQQAVSLLTELPDGGLPTDQSQSSQPQTPAQNFEKLTPAEFNLPSVDYSQWALQNSVPSAPTAGANPSDGGPPPHHLQTGQHLNKARPFVAAACYAPLPEIRPVDLTISLELPSGYRPKGPRYKYTEKGYERIRRPRTLEQIQRRKGLRERKAAGAAPPPRSSGLEVPDAHRDRNAVSAESASDSSSSSSSSDDEMDDRRSTKPSSPTMGGFRQDRLRGGRDVNSLHLTLMASVSPLNYAGAPWAPVADRAGFPDRPEEEVGASGLLRSSRASTPPASHIPAIRRKSRPISAPAPFLQPQDTSDGFAVFHSNQTCGQECYSKNECIVCSTAARLRVIGQQSTEGGMLWGQEATDLAVLLLASHRASIPPGPLRLQPHSQPQPTIKISDENGTPGSRTPQAPELRTPQPPPASIGTPQAVNLPQARNSDMPNGDAVPQPNFVCPEDMDPFSDYQPYYNPPAMTKALPPPQLNDVIRMLEGEAPVTFSPTPPTDMPYFDSLSAASYPQAVSDTLDTLQGILCGLTGLQATQGPLALESIPALNMGPSVQADWGYGARGEDRVGRGPVSQAQGVPSVLVGHEEELLCVSPMALPVWEKLALEPYGQSRAVRYVVMAPSSDFIREQARIFANELKCSYEVLRLGTHKQLQHHHISDGVYSVDIKPEQNIHEASILPNSVRDSVKMMSYYKACNSLATVLGDELRPKNKYADMQFHVNSLPHHVIYIVNPFTHPSAHHDICVCFASLLLSLPQALRHLVVLQVVPVDWLLTPGMGGIYRRTNIVALTRAVAMTVYAKCRVALFPRKPLLRNDGAIRVYPQDELFCPLYVLTAYRPPPMIAGDTQSLYAPEDMVEHTLHLCYVLSGPWLVCVWTDPQGELLNTHTFFIAPLPHPPQSQPPTPSQRLEDNEPPTASRRLVGLLWQQICLTVAKTTLSWRVVVGRLGLMPDKEYAAWKEVSGSLAYWNKEIIDNCSICSMPTTTAKTEHPQIVSLSVVTVGLDTNFQVLESQGSMGGSNSAMPSPSPGPGPGGHRNSISGRTNKLARTVSVASTRQNMEPQSQAGHLSRTWIVSLPQGHNTSELKPRVWRSAASAYIVTVPTQPMTRALNSANLAPALAASEGPFYVKVGLMVHQSLLAGVRTNGNLEIRMKSSSSMDVDLASPTTTDQDRMALIHHIAAQYNALSWLTLSPMSDDRRSFLPLHFAVLTRLAGLVCREDALTHAVQESLGLAT